MQTVTDTPTSQNQQSNHDTPRLEPIEQPDSLKLKLVYWMARQQMGSVITPLKVIQARLPETIPAAHQIKSAEKKLPLSDRVKFLIKLFTASRNGCTFCTDMARAEAVERTIDTTGVRELMKFEESSHFSAAEKAVLRYIDQINRTKQVDDSVFESLTEHFSEREIIAITWLNAVENYYNMMNHPLNIPSDDLYRELQAE